MRSGKERGRNRQRTAFVPAPLPRAPTHSSSAQHRCLAERKEWEECLTVLGGLDAEEPEALNLALPRPAAPPGTAGINYFSVVCLLRG